MDEARRRSIAARSELADAFAANVRPIIKEIQASGVSSLRGVAKALTRLSLSAPKPDEQPTATPPQPHVQPTEQPSRLRRAWRWMRATG